MPCKKISTGVNFINILCALFSVKPKCNREKLHNALSYEKMRVYFLLKLHLQIPFRATFSNLFAIQRMWQQALLMWRQARFKDIEILVVLDFTRILSE